MLNLQFRHIIHAAMECHLIIECHLLCYKWIPRWVSAGGWVWAEMENWSTLRTYCKKRKVLFMREFKLYISQLCSSLFLSSALCYCRSFPHIHTWTESSKSTLSGLTGIAGGHTNTHTLLTHTLLEGRSRRWSWPLRSHTRGGKHTPF